MTRQQIELALQEVGNLIASPMAIVIGGSAASVLRGEVSREAGDCDVADVLPAGSDQSLFDAAARIAETLHLEQDWLNADLIAWQEEYPQDWRSRLTNRSQYGLLQVSLISRPDCVSMMALRLGTGDPDQDLADIQEINLTADEKLLVAHHMDFLADQGFEVTAIQFALGLI